MGLEFAPLYSEDRPSCMLNFVMSRHLEVGSNPGAPRFLTIISTLTRGGTERAAVNYALGYKREGFHSAVLAYNGGGIRKPRLDDEGIPVFIGGRDDALIEDAIDQARSWQPDILHLHRPGLPDPASAAILRALIHPALRVFETNVFGYVDDSPDRELIDVHLQLSRWSMWKWRHQSANLRPRPLGVVVPYSVDLAAFSPAGPVQRAVLRDVLGIPRKAVVFGRVGQQDPMKWSPWLIDSFAEIASQRKDAWLLTVGLPAELAKKVKALQRDARDRVVQLRPIDSDEELSRYYSTMDIFVHAAIKGESFGMVLCEAMLSGLPVITVSRPMRDNSQIEVVRNGVTGMVVDSRRTLTAAMLRLADDQDLRRRLGQAGHGWVLGSYSIAEVAPRLATLAGISLMTATQEDLMRYLIKDADYRTSAAHDTADLMLADAGLPASRTTIAAAALANSPLARSAVNALRKLRLFINGATKTVRKVNIAEAAARIS